MLQVTDIGRQKDIYSTTGSNQTTVGGHTVPHEQVGCVYIGLRRDRMTLTLTLTRHKTGDGDENVRGSQPVMREGGRWRGGERGRERLRWRERAERER